MQRKDELPQQTGPRINDKIRVREVRLIDSQGKMVGVVSLDRALFMANEQSLDLVEISPQVRPPVCKIMDYGKYKYEQSKKAVHVRKTKLKTIRLHPKTDDHMVGIKVEQIKDFIARGDKVQIEVKFRGREMAHQEIGRELINRVIKTVESIARVESYPRTEGKTLIAVLGKK